MSSEPKPNRFRSFAFYLVAGYLVAYIFCTAALYAVSSLIILTTTRKFDRQDAMAESEELEELIAQDPEGQLLAEQVTTGRYPPSTIFVVRIINRLGQVEYTISWPQRIELPQWDASCLEESATSTHSEHYIAPLQRRIQILTTRLADGRILQVGKGSFLEVDQRRMMGRMLLVFVALSTLFTAISSVFLLGITIRPIRSITSAMSRIIKEGAYEEGAPMVSSMITEINTLGKLFGVMTGKYANLIQAMRQTMENLAHDFRTPLTRIRGSAEVALNSGDIPAQASDVLADIIEDCDHAQMQLQNIMDTREMESGFVKLEMGTLRVRQLMEGIVEMYSIVAEERGVTLSAEYPAEELYILGDRQRLSRVFANLIDNAVKYTEKGGWVRVSFEREAERVIVIIRDNGIGIPDIEKGLIWQRLFRGACARESAKGLGLGLSIARIIVEAHHGTVQVESAEGQGTTFRVALPSPLSPS